ncbi:hypothetical protein KFL_003940080 [Klebsormidium nitens]|uniref:JmjC domain-containing protein n=1 Tax=Klebsormidium nitens TaxID=105231 RepID=A0A1Y1IH25_KLENI|nr:hypothetical protein KFL_003940080 [Klebsormidium nitens]|eukprot:GAQ88017.1 hypothetical protein KFL_003940080 [Klebsormidium nitens]
MRQVHRLPAHCSASELSAALHSGEPFVISLQQEDVPDQELAALKQRLAGKTVHGWQGDKSIELSIDDVVDLWLEDRLPCNIVDSYVKGVFSVPDFLAETNLLSKHPDTEERTVSLYLSSSNAYTPFHVDAYGFAGWAFLFRGSKRWEFVHPQHYTEFHDAALGGPRDTPGNELPAEVELWRTTAGERDVVYIPPGWLHRVWTDQPSFGFGGACAMPWEVEQVLQHWRQEKELGIALEKDLDEIFRTISAVTISKRTAP